MNTTTALRTYLDFEKPILELENKVAELKALETEGKGPQITEEIAKLEQKAKAALADTYAKLNSVAEDACRPSPGAPARARFHRRPDRRVHAARRRPLFGEDFAIVGGFGRFRGEPICVIGQEKGSDTRVASITISAWRGPKAIARRSV